MRNFLCIAVFWITIQSFAQVAPSKYLVKFTDKDQSPYSLSQPEEYLSQRAIDRRTRQEISMDITDIPIDPNYILGVTNTGAKLIVKVKWENAIIIETNSTSVIETIQALSYVSGVNGINKRSSAYKSRDKGGGL